MLTFSLCSADVKSPINASNLRRSTRNLLTDSGTTSPSSPSSLRENCNDRPPRSSSLPSMVLPFFENVSRQSATDNKRNADLLTGLHEFYTKNVGTYELRAQLCENIDEQPVEDSRYAWDADKYPFVTIATITIPAQETCSPARLDAWGNIRVDVWNGLETLKPLGSINRVRKFGQSSTRLASFELMNFESDDARSLQSIPPRSPSDTPPTSRRNLFLSRSKTSPSCRFLDIVNVNNDSVLCLPIYSLFCLEFADCIGQRARFRRDF